MKSNRFSGEVTVFQEKRLPEPAVPVGYAALIGNYALSVPLPGVLSAIGNRHKVFEKEGWRIYTPRHQPEDTLEGQLVFALKYEGLDLAVLKKLFEKISGDEMIAMISRKPTSAYMRRLWFLYEWLLDERLDLADARTGSYVDVVDSSQQYAVVGRNSKRHRVRNNLPGTRHFCPLVFRTPKIESYLQKNLAVHAQKLVGHLSADLLARTAAFLLLKDSKSSYAIEGESPPQDRIQRWGRAIGEAGKQPLDLDELLRLQKIVIGKDQRFLAMGLRGAGGFVGEHERSTRLPLPEHISAKHEDLPELVQGLIDFARQYATGLDPVIAAAILAFGFVYIHPFEDGNGRIHRYLLHHVLAERGFNPPGIVFPVSAVILARIEEYRQVLQSYSKRLLPLIEWEPTERMNVRVLNATGDFYRYYDATPHVEFLYSCVQQTIEVDLPNEIEFLQKYDQFKAKVTTLMEMPASTVDLLFNFLNQNQGKLSKRARDKEFSAMREDEVHYVEEAYRDVFTSQNDRT